MALLWFHLAGIVALYALQRMQNLLPLNPQQFDAVTPDLALNTAVSFATNTSWQSYGGETTLSYLVQMAGITVQSFLSGATGVVVAIALVRGFARRSAQTIGNFWVDLTRVTLYVLLPICMIAGLFLIWQGVPETFGAYISATTLEGANQVLARGPVASQKVIAVLSGDGGGFFNANGAHPFENPTALTGILEMLLIFLIGVALTNTFGRMVGDQRHGWALFAAMAVMFTAGLSDAGPHGFSELLYAYTSGAATNGSAFAGLSANTPFYNLTLAAAMFAGRFIVIVPVLCIAGTLAAKRIVPASAGTLPTHGAQFVGLLVGTVLIVGGLTFFPALALGPVAEQFAIQAGLTY
jgi:K+-transporting ATPase ATPase A chain